MNNYFVILLVLGATTLIASFLPIVLKRYKISFTIPLLCIGAILYYLKAPLPWPQPTWDIDIVLRFSELVVIICLMVAGLKIGLNYSWKEWKNPFRLLSITMPLTMLVVFLIAFYFLDFGGPISLLLASVLAPTDPALASEIQLNKKQSEANKNVGLQYNLTAEAGLNDGLAFPFVFFAILWSKNDTIDADLLQEWVLYYVVYKIIVGTAIGIALGFLYSYFTKKLSKNNARRIHHAFIALSLTLVSYAIAEICNSYGFLSVFFTGLFAHYYQHRKNETLESEPSLGFIENIEKILIIVWMIFFGGSIISGILSYITLQSALFCVALVLILRPLLGYYSLKSAKMDRLKKIAIAFFGIRGIGSVFYLTYAIKYGYFGDTNQLFSIVALVILISIVLHGVTAKRVINKLLGEND